MYGLEAPRNRVLNARVRTGSTVKAAIGHLSCKACLIIDQEGPQSPGTEKPTGNHLRRAVRLKAMESRPTFPDKIC